MFKSPLIQRALLAVIGPADVMDPDAPGHPYEPHDDLCPRCGRAWTTHPVTRDPELGSISTCPADSLV